MKSREALEKIKDFVKENTNVNTWDNPISDIDDCYETIEQDLDKLNQLEDIEKELEIDLSILKKVLEHGQEKYVYFKDRNNKIHKCDRAIINIHVCVDVLDKPVGSGYFCQENLYLDDYGKTWALDKNELTREELEDEK